MTSMESVALYEGKYGPYVKWEKVNATLPKEIAPEAVTLDQALELIAVKAPAKPARKAKKAAAKKPPAGKRTAKKGPPRKAAKKPAASKTAAE